ncbi:MAG TPA: diguanylate cyclase [Rhodocyclaceae bacterium]|nr:diguanylate cyclase [Rhodocyclaceae bacterium]
MSQSLRSATVYLREHPFIRQWLIIALVLGLFSLVVAYDLVHERQSILADTAERLQSDARIINDNLSAQLDAANTALIDIARDIPKWQGDANGLQGATRRLTAMARVMPGVRSVSIIDANGVVLASSLPELLSYNLGARAYFERARRLNAPHLLQVSAPFRSFTGNYVIALTHSYTDRNGEFAGIVVASLDYAYFDTLLRSTLHTPDMWSSVLHEDGQMFVTVPITTTDISRLPNESLARHHQDSGRTVSLQEGISAVSGDRRIMAFHTIQPPHLQMDKALIVSVSRNLDLVLAEWRNMVWVLGGTVLAVALLAIGLQLYHQRTQMGYERRTAQARQAMQAAENRFTAAFNEAPIGMLLRNADGQLLQLNHALADMLGMEPAALQALDPVSLMQADDRTTEQELMHEMLAGRRAAYQAEVRFRHAAGHWVTALLSVSCVHNEAGHIEYLIKHIQDISLMKQQADQLLTMAHYDKLTGLPNRAMLEDRMRQSLALAHRQGSLLAVGFLDLDDFKPVNDRYGHAAGDEVLVVTAQRMAQRMRGEDTLARLGGDEFVLLLTSLGSVEEYLQVVERLRHEIEQPITLSNGAVVSISASFGISFYPDDSDNPETLLRYADRAMYIAKYSGTHCHRFSGNLSAIPSPPRNARAQAEGGT